MGITAIPGSPMYEEMTRRQMVNQQAGGNPYVGQESSQVTNPLTNYSYDNWKNLAQNTGQNYGIVDTMLKNNKNMAEAYGPPSPGSGSAGGAAGGYGGMDPGLSSAMNADYDRSRLGMLGTSKAMDKRLQGSFNERFGGAETGLLTNAQQTNQKNTMDQLSGLEVQRNLAQAQARERAEERALRAKEAEQARIDRQRMANSSAYSGGGLSYNSKQSGYNPQAPAGPASGGSGYSFDSRFPPGDPRRFGGAGGGPGSPPPGAPPPGAPPAGGGAINPPPGVGPPPGWDPNAIENQQNSDFGDPFGTGAPPGGGSVPGMVGADFGLGLAPNMAPPPMPGVDQQYPGWDQEVLPSGAGGGLYGAQAPNMSMMNYFASMPAYGGGGGSYSGGYA